ncbi:MAG: PQQ-dependent sugar dehydrogenase [Gammaproteobacteria bacterium]|nr:PQQ-dependent sugar dehydrogenase [Gammaproteobacteria bacterium]MDH4255366.1 PQQ-dependent sugar dehydrogenase [Gammaproteobacteria bacterium]
MLRQTLLTLALMTAVGFAVWAPPSQSGSKDARSVVFRIELVADGLQIPWAMAFLPDGRLLVSERAAGRLSRVDPTDGRIEPLQGGPEDVFVKDNAGMFDVVLHPHYAETGWIYYAYTAGDSALNTTVVERAQLAGLRLTDRERLFEARPWYHNSIVYGCRLAFRDGYLFITMGDRWDLRHLSQSPGSHLGKIMRLHDDGRVPADNPFVDVPGAEPAVWALGVRNPQGLAVHPETGLLWEHEHGPLGGDEVNIIQAGANYGWPVITYGKEYSGDPVGDGLTGREGLEQPVHYYVPSIAPSGMLFYSGELFPGWRSNLFIGALAKTHLNRLELDGDRVVNEERLLEDRGWRVRALAEGPEGAIYIATDDGYVRRLVPAGALR